jgi:predicted TIM-barrel fold metal-dependent hydrolase
VVIDCQSHLYVPAVLDRLATRTGDFRVYWKGEHRYVQMGAWHRRVFAGHSDVDAMIARMDANGVTLATISINDPGPEWFDSDSGTVASLCNDFIAGCVRRHPTRLRGLCVLPLNDVEASLAEFDRCVNTLGMRGLLLYTNIAGRFPDEPVYRPIFQRAVEHDVPVLLHPAKPVTLDATAAYELASGVGNMLEDTIALSRLIMSGLLDELPALKLVCPHLGGALPFIIGRLDHQTQVLRRGPKLRRKPGEYLRDVWFDIVSPLPEAIEFMHRLVGHERLLFASDYPWVAHEVILETLRKANIPPDHREAILHRNAQRLFRL